MAKLIYDYVQEVSKNTNISDTIGNFIRDNLSINLSTEDTSITVKLHIKDELVDSSSDEISINKRDVYDLD